MNPWLGHCSVTPIRWCLKLHILFPPSCRLQYHQVPTSLSFYVHMQETDRHNLDQRAKPCIPCAGTRVNFLSLLVVPEPATALPSSVCIHINQSLLLFFSEGWVKTTIHKRLNVFSAHTSPSVKRVGLSATHAYEPSVCLSITCHGPALIFCISDMKRENNLKFRPLVLRKVLQIW